jgi:transcriptional/translational regulatory protein YebC/TACO1
MVDNQARQSKSGRTKGQGASSTCKRAHGRLKKYARKDTRKIILKLASYANSFATDGGAEPSLNPRLGTAIANAKRGGFSKSSIEGAIARGQGRSASGAALETVTMEAIMPPAAIMIDCETDSKARVLQDLRVIMKKYGAREGPTAYLFEKRGRSIFTPKDGVGVDEVFDTAIDVMEGEEGRIVVDTIVEDTKVAEKQIAEGHELEIESSENVWHPNAETQVEDMDDAVYTALSNLQQELEDYDDVRSVFTNFVPVEDAEAPAATAAA